MTLFLFLLRAAMLYAMIIIFFTLNAKVCEYDTASRQPTRSEDIDFEKYGWEPYLVDDFGERYKHKTHKGYYLSLGIRNTWRLMKREELRFKEVKKKEGRKEAVEVTGMLCNEHLESFEVEIKGYKALRPSYESKQAI